MHNKSFESDEVILFELDYLPSGRPWFNVWAKRIPAGYEVWISECDPVLNLSHDVLHKSYGSMDEAEKVCLELARSLNQLTGSKEIMASTS